MMRILIGAIAFGLCGMSVDGRVERLFLERMGGEGECGSVRSFFG